MLFISFLFLLHWLELLYNVKSKWREWKSLPCFQRDSIQPFTIKDTVSYQFFQVEEVPFYSYFAVCNFLTAFSIHVEMTVCFGFDLLIW